jgi:hypothetical protein
MMRYSAKLTVFPLLIVCALAVTQCSSDDTLAPFQPEVNSVTDNFQLQATGVDTRTTALDYSWENTGSQGTVSHSTTTSAGTARVVVRDDGGTIVYDNLLMPSLEESTATGVSGTWTVRLVLSDYSGTLNFRIQKR